MEKSCPLIDCENWQPSDNLNPCNECRLSKATAAMGFSQIHYKQTHITLEQYKERTGEDFPDNGIVWVQHTIDLLGNWCDWKVMLYKDAADEKRICFNDIAPDNFVIHCILPAQPPKNIRRKRFGNIV